MEIKQKFGEFTKAELFNLSKGIGTRQMKDVEDGKLLEVVGAVILTDKSVNPETGEVKEKDILHLKCKDGVYTTESPYITSTFCAAADFMQDWQLSFILLRGKSKNGRQFMDLELVDSQKDV